jgi:zinc transport system substrate-binding protein
MKKIISVLAAALLAVSSLAACSAGNEGVANKGSDKIDVVTTIFPEYDWVVNILGDKADNAEVTMLLDNGVDLHSFQPTAFDIAKIADCDLFIYVGGESDEWVDDALSEATNKDMVVINLLDVLGSTVKEEEVKEGMEGEEEEEEEAEEEGPEYDEHVWLSLANAKVLCKEIERALSQIDPDYESVYFKNEADYEDKLDELDKEYREVVDAAPNKTLLFGDRFPFRYLVDDYGLDYYAAFVGCSAETEASFETITFLAGKMDELSLPCILTIEKSDQKIAETIRNNTQLKTQAILALDSMQSTTSQDVTDGATYYSIMKDNLEVLKRALK